MTITLKNVETLIARNLKRRVDDLASTKADIEALEDQLERKKKYAEKLSFFIDKFSKFSEIIEMDKKNDKPFEEIHKDILPVVDERVLHRTPNSIPEEIKDITIPIKAGAGLESEPSEE